MGPQMLADTLTKTSASPAYLHQVMSRGRYQVVRDSTLEDKVKKAGQELGSKVIKEERVLSEEKRRKRAANKQLIHKRRVQILKGVDEVHKKGTRTSFSAYNALSTSLIHSVLWLTS